MSGWRFVLSRKWAGYFTLVVVFAIASCMLGNWQFARRAEARVAIDLIVANYDRQPAPIAEVLPELNDYDPTQQWTPVVVTGQYLADDELLVRNRPRGGQPGFEVLTPFLLDSGEVFIVDRGWLPTGSRQDEPDAVPAAPEGSVTVTARLTAGEPVLNRSAPAGTNQIATINLEQIAERIGADQMYSAAYGQLAEQTPAPESTPAAFVKPELDEGPHLSYALQWYVFALLAFIGLGWALQHDYRLINADDPKVREKEAERARKKALRRPTDAETEDALLDGA